MKNTEKPEAQDAPLNKYAFADQRYDTPELEKNNKTEFNLITALVSHIIDNRQVPRQQANLIVKLLSDNMYGFLLRKPDVEFIYRGMGLNVARISRMLSSEQLAELNERKQLILEGEFMFVPLKKSQNGTSSSWAKDELAASQFKNSYSNKFSVILEASTSDNDSKLLDLTQLYDSISRVKDFKDEKEVVAFGSVKTKKIRFIVNDYFDQNERKFHETTEEEAKKRIEDIIEALKIQKKSPDHIFYSNKIISNFMNNEIAELRLRLSEQFKHEVFREIMKHSLDELSVGVKKAILNVINLNNPRNSFFYDYYYCLPYTDSAISKFEEYVRDLLLDSLIQILSSTKDGNYLRVYRAILYTKDTTIDWQKLIFNKMKKDHRFRKIVGDLTKYVAKHVILTQKFLLREASIEYAKLNEDEQKKFIKSILDEKPLLPAQQFEQIEHMPPSDAIVLLKIKFHESLKER